MPQRVTDTDVKEILATGIPTQPFIFTANVLVDQHLSTAGLTAVQLVEIERWLTAHLVVTSRDPRLEEENLPDGMKFKYHMAPLGKGLDGSAYGQTVKMLDTSGTLVQVETGKSATFRVD